MDSLRNKIIKNKFVITACDIVIFTIKDNKLQVLKLSSEEVEVMKRQQLKKVLGFRAVFKDLVNSKVPLVGHNCMYDLLFMMKYLQSCLN
jgi:hypothetical protein